ncbi:hypothetical protein LUU34_00511300 [Aix galericulata]|nr:hypothetical protein LUU34_00511300 [Aix galericulata]
MAAAPLASCPAFGRGGGDCSNISAIPSREALGTILMFLLVGKAWEAMAVMEGIFHALSNLGLSTANLFAGGEQCQSQTDNPEPLPPSLALARSEPRGCPQLQHCLRGKLSRISLRNEMQRNGDELRGRSLPREKKSSDTPAMLLPIPSARPVVVALRGLLSICAAPGQLLNTVRLSPGLVDEQNHCLGKAESQSTYERENTEDASIRKSLDGFYETYCKNGPGRADPTCEAASRCLSQKVSELANRGGSKYALRCLQMAQVVLNRDGCKIFPNYPTTACFSKPAEGEAVLEDTKRTPGLSDDVLQLLLKQTRTEHSPDVLHENWQDHCWLQRELAQRAGFPAGLAVTPWLAPHEEVQYKPRSELLLRTNNDVQLGVEERRKRRRGKERRRRRDLAGGSR